MLNQSRVTWGGLKCALVDALPDGQNPRKLVFLAHGFGAPGTDLVPFAEELFESEPALKSGVRFVFPAGPLSLEDEGIPGRAWWPLNIAELQRRLATGRFEDIRNEKPPGLIEARGMIHAMLQDACAATGLTVGDCVLGGFSQGAMVMCDAATSLPEAVGGLVLLSGLVVNEVEWRAGAAKHSAIPVFQSHGRYDVLLPFLTSEWLRDVWTGPDRTVEFVAFNDGHTIPWPVLTAVGAFLKARLA